MGFGKLGFFPYIYNIIKNTRIVRKLASIQRIRNIQPIEGADNIELATINNWKVVVAKDVGHKIGDMVVYCEIDSFLPIRDEFEFLRKTSYKKMGDLDGFRLKTIKLRGAVSQGLILPIYVIPFDAPINVIQHYEGNEGEDVSEILGIVKYEPPIPAELTGTVKGNFPSFIPKTNEERVQNLTNEFEKWKNAGIKFYEAEKLDGSSATIFLNDGVFGICSRNWELEESEGNSFWRVARELKLEEIMRDWAAGQKGFFKNHAIQGELIGEGIQGNPYKLKGQTIRFFNLFDIDSSTRAPFDIFESYMGISELQTVPIINTEYALPDSVDELLAYVDGKSILNTQTNREGSVFRSLDGSISFKGISNKFLLKNEK